MNAGTNPALVTVVFSGAGEGAPQVVVQLDGGPGAFCSLDVVVGEVGLVLLVNFPPFLIY